MQQAARQHRQLLEDCGLDNYDSTPDAHSLWQATRRYRRAVRDDVMEPLREQVAALDPIAVTREDVPEDVVEEEKDVARESAINEGKPEHVIDQIVDGKLERFFEDNVLLEQAFVKDSSVSVQEMLDDAGLSVQRFVRYALGD